jgi:hypothetical protein
VIQCRGHRKPIVSTDVWVLNTAFHIFILHIQ